jgi:hypothetical protein
MNKKDVEKFMTELSNLSSQYGIKICGCGCCGSPFLRKIEKDSGGYAVDENKRGFEELRWEDGEQLEGE